MPADCGKNKSAVTQSYKAILYSNEKELSATESNNIYEFNKHTLSKKQTKKNQETKYKRVYTA